MKLAFGHFHYPPAVFWEMSFREWQAAVKGYEEKNRDPDHVQPMTRKQFEELEARHVSGKTA